MLIIDDEPKICEIIAEILLEAGYKVTCFNSGIGVLDFIRHNQVDLLILDIYMPGMDGMSLINEMKYNDINLSIILLTGLYLKPKEKTKLKEEVFAFIDKPVELQSLMNYVKQATAQIHHH